MENCFLAGILSAYSNWNLLSNFCRWKNSKMEQSQYDRGTHECKFKPC